MLQQAGLFKSALELLGLRASWSYNRKGCIQVQCPPNPQLVGQMGSLELHKQLTQIQTSGPKLFTYALLISLVDLGLIYGTL